MTLDELSRTIAEHILFTHVSDIENLTVSEMSTDYVVYGDDETLKAEYGEDYDKWDALYDAVHEQLDKAIVGISWDGGKTWQQ